jgi:hypothetical protein
MRVRVCVCVRAFASLCECVCNMVDLHVTIWYLCDCVRVSGLEMVVLDLVMEVVAGARRSVWHSAAQLKTDDGADRKRNSKERRISRACERTLMSYGLSSLPIPPKRPKRAYLPMGRSKVIPAAKSSTNHRLCWFTTHSQVE